MVENRFKIASKRGPKLISVGPKWSSVGFLGGPWKLCGSRTPLKRIKSLYRRLLGSSWAPSRGQVGGQKATMGSPGRRFESIFERLGCLLVRFFEIFMPNRPSVSLFFLRKPWKLKNISFLDGFCGSASMFEAKITQKTIQGGPRGFLRRLRRLLGRSSTVLESSDTIWVRF